MRTRLINASNQFIRLRFLDITAIQMGLTMIVLVLLMTTVEIDGGNRFQSITTRCCRKGGAIYHSTEYPTPTSSPEESAHTMPLIAPLPAKSQYVQYHRAGGIQSDNRGGSMQSESRARAIQSDNRGGSMQSESRVGGIQSENGGGSIQSEVTAGRPAP